MKLLFESRIIEFNQVPTVEMVIDTINELLKNDFYYSYLEADNQKVLEDPESFLMKELGGISVLKVVAIPAKKFIWDLIVSGEEYIKSSKPYIIELITAFYNNPTTSDWTSLAELFEGIQWFASMIDNVASSKIVLDEWISVSESFNILKPELKNLEEALQNRDAVLIADIIQYEVLSVFDDISNKISEIIENEGLHHDFN